MKRMVVEETLQALKEMDDRLWDVLGNEDRLVQRVRKSIVEAEDWLKVDKKRLDIRDPLPGEECNACGSPDANKLVYNIDGRQIQCVFCRLKDLEARLAELEERLGT